MTGENKSKLNRNAGFSLVELLIAITILAIIVIPLLNVFLSSHKLNSKSRQIQRATTMAQDIMEGLKAYNIEELKEQFHNPSDGFYVIDDNIIKGEIKEEFSLEVDEHGDPCDGLYYFSMSKITLQGTEYDALVKVDARDYTEGGAHTQKQTNVDAGGVPQAHNNNKIAKVGNVNNDHPNKPENKDGLYTEDALDRESDLSKIWDVFESELEANGVEETEFSYTTTGLSVSRRFQIDITDSGTKDEENNIIADAVISVEYECSYNGHTEQVYGVDHDPCGSFTSGNFYLFYYPLYEAIDEEIIINNADNLPLCMTIAKQIDTTTGAKMTDSQLSAAEMNYKALVQFLGCNEDKLKIRTNLGTNLVNSTFLGAEGLSSAVPTQVTFELNGYINPNLNVFDLSGVRNTTLGAPGTDDKITEMIYDVEVTIYKEGAAAGGFKDEDKNITIEGSKNN